MRKSLFIVLSCVFLATQGIAYQFNINTKYGKLQQQCIKSDMKSCRAMGRLSGKKDRKCL